MGSPGWWATHISKDDTAVFTRTLLSLAALAALFTVVGLAAPITRAAEIAYVATDVLNLRDAPSTDGAVVAELLWGEDVKVVAGPTEDGWFQVVNQETTGWVTGEFLAWSAVGGAYPGSDGGAAATAAGARWIDVDRSSGIVTLFDGAEVVASYPAAMGWDLSDDGYFATANGTYQVYAKNADLTWSEIAQVYLTQWVAFDPDRANGFHAYSMDSEGNVTAGLGTPTGGCVALAPEAAAELFAFAEIGMTVEVHW